MWDYEGFIGKAELYFARGREHPKADDELLALWLLLGLEFLLRAPLAKVHPTLLADPTGEAVMAAAGFAMKPDSGPPKSVQSKTVILRLGVAIPEFTKERQDDATFLAGLRNAELHSSDSPLSLDNALWLPAFTRVVEVVCEHLGLDPEDVVGEEIIGQGRSLVSNADKRLEHEVSERIKAARAFFSQLRAEEVEARRAPETRLPSQGYFHGHDSPEIVTCPGCDQRVVLTARPVRTTNERLEDDEIVRDVVYIATGMSCSVCGLNLSSTAEVRVAKLEQQYVREEGESLADRYINGYEGDDYGND